VSSLVETSILIRLTNDTDINHAVARYTVMELGSQGETLYITPQVLVEFRSVATRPKDVNGLGYTFDEAEAKAQTYEDLFQMLPENDAIFPAWKALVKAGGVIGKQVHDARLAAICQVYNIDKIVTFNARHFIRLASFVPGLTITDPRTIQP